MGWYDLSSDFYQLQVAFLLNAFHNPFLELPASHLAGVEPACQFIGRCARIVAKQECHPECIGKGDLASVKYSVRCCRLLTLATGAAPGVRLFTLAIVSVAAMTALKAILPFLIGQELQALLLF